MVDWYIALRTGAGCTQLVTENANPGVGNKLVFDKVNVVIKTGLINASDANGYAKRLIPNWNKTKYWTVFADNQGCFTGSDRVLLLRKSPSQAFDPFLNSDFRLNGALVCTPSGDRMNFTHTKPETKPIYLNDFKETRNPTYRR